MSNRSIARAKGRLQDLFHKRTHESILFNRALILLNILVFGLFGLEALYPGHPSVHALEITFGVLFTLEYLARLWVAPRKTSFVFNVYSIIDIIAIASLYAPLLTGNLALLRILRSLKILRTYYLVRIARNESSFFARYQATITSVLNFLVFLAIMTAIVFVAEAQANPYINTYIDALYFTVATLTTTGYGDVTAIGPYGKLLSVVAMLIGITLFLHLTRVIFRGSKLYYTCDKCGLSAHEIDAIHCKHCGATLKARHSGDLF